MNKIISGSVGVLCIFLLSACSHDDKGSAVTQTTVDVVSDETQLTEQTLKRQEIKKRMSEDVARHNKTR